MKIDSHQHFWNFDPERHAWINDDMGTLKRDFLPQDLGPILHKYGIDGCVSVQADQSEAETEYLLGFAENYQFIKGVVGWVDLQAADLDERLSHYTQFKKLKGFRHVLQDESDLDFMLRPAFLKGVSRLKEHGLTYDILIYPEHLPNVVRFVGEFLDQPFVIDHLAKPVIRQRQIREWRNQIRAVAAYENVHCKLSGMVTEADWHNWHPEDFDPYTDVILEAFGAKRIMYGSDWPVCTVASTYRETLDLAQRFAGKLSNDEQALFWGENAVAFYHL
ncbi:MAG: amidohydrolase family protein [Mucilaginibacter polytrichastri]|nr:amidohydrolase family protein [Mucilaginibacter polytrichastri]